MKRYYHKLLGIASNITGKSTESLEQFLLFGTIGGLGTIVNTAVLWLLHSIGGAHYLLAGAVATETAIIFNFIGNHSLTFRNAENGKSLTQKFISFQAISLITLALTLAILWALTTTFGEALVLVWNLIAIVITFLANFGLNKAVTWGDGLPKLYTPNKRAYVMATIAVLLALAAAPAAADLVATTQHGYHPDSPKTVVVYTDASTGTYSIQDSTGTTVHQGTLQQPTNYDGEPVNCQGNNPCLTGDFTNLTQTGTYTAVTSHGNSEHDFTIGEDVYADTIPTLLTFFDAQKQQDSTYHADLHESHEPAFTITADGSFLMTADQASNTLIELGSAYRRNPAAFSGTALATHTQEYVDYLEGLQGLDISESTSGEGFRTNHGMQVEAFTPAPTNITSIDVYTPGTYDEPTLEDVPVTPLCSENDTACLEYAAENYKCQADEPCLNITYIDTRGTVTSTTDGLGVSQGWEYDFGCYFDVDLTQERFADTPNPCMVFVPEDTAEDTSRALHAYLQAVPALSDSGADAQSVVDNAAATAAHINSHYGGPGSTTGHYGAALFLLYDYTGDEEYLERAHAQRSAVSSSFVSDGVRGNTYYWEEYARHKDSIEDAELEYPVGGEDPAQYFRGKIFGDYKDRGPTSISNTGERVYQFDNNIQFSQSKFILSEAAFAAKAADLNPGAESFIQDVAEHQFFFLTGTNAVQTEASLNSPVDSYSFIIGLGDNQPTQFHSRLLIDTGYSEDGLLGARGTGYEFLDKYTQNVSEENASSDDFVSFDGTTHILGGQFGSLGNQWRGEAYNDPWQVGKTFPNGEDAIDGWINGPFDVNSEDDTIFNYRDDVHTYEHTETTNEMVASAIELAAYLDAQHNDRSPHSTVSFNITPSNGTGNETGNETGGNETEQNGTLTIDSDPQEATVTVDGSIRGTTVLTLELAAGNHTVQLNKNEYEDETRQATIEAGEQETINVTLTPTTNETEQNGTLTIDSDPQGASVRIDGAPAGTTPTAKELPAGNYTVQLNKDGYEDETKQATVTAEEETTVNETLTPTQNQTGNATITSHTTSAPAINGSHNIHETETAAFNVETSSDATVQWLLDGTQQNTTTGTSHEHAWTPDILYSAGLEAATITARTETDEHTWTVYVDDTINPFFSAPDGGSDVVGAEQTQVHVFTDDAYLDAGAVSVTIKTRSGASKTVALEKGFVNEEHEETDWRKTLSRPTLEYGDNTLTHVTITSNETGTNTTYRLTAKRGHYVQEPREERSSGGGGGGGGGSASLGTPTFSPNIKYARFTDDVVGVDNQTTIRTDLETFENDIVSATATVRGPNGTTTTTNLALASGDHTYGTWKGNYTPSTAGRHALQTITAHSQYRQNHTFTNLTATTYATAGGVTGDEELELVTFVLSQSTVRNGSIVVLTLDARDAAGLTGVTAHLTNENDTTDVPLSLNEGDEHYGTWKGTFTATKPDSTYHITGVTLANEELSATRPVQNRSVYVQPVEETAQQGSAATGSATEQLTIEEVRSHPLAPAIAGFLLLATFVTLGFTTNALRSET